MTLFSYVIISKNILSFSPMKRNQSTVSITDMTFSCFQGQCGRRDQTRQPSEASCQAPRCSSVSSPRQAARTLRGCKCRQVITALPDVTCLTQAAKEGGGRAPGWLCTSPAGVGSCRTSPATSPPPAPCCCPSCRQPEPWR